MGAFQISDDESNIHVADDEYKRGVSSRSNGDEELYKYNYTQMYVDLNKVKQKTIPPQSYRILFDKETLYHYCNLILDEYNSKKVSLVLFKNDLQWGPRDSNASIYLHPFQYNHKWHLALGFKDINKIILVNCQGNIDKVSSFPIEASLEIKSFVLFFKHKLSKSALKYPANFIEYFEPPSNFNSINLLSVVLTFCLDPITLTNCFCNPNASPRKFDISQVSPVIDNIDLEFRSNYLFMIEEKLKEKRNLEFKLLDEQRRKHKEQLARIDEQRRHREREELERKEKLQREIQEREKAYREKLERERQIREQQRIEIKRQEMLAIESRIQAQNKDYGRTAKSEDENENANKNEVASGTENIVKRRKLDPRPLGTVDAPFEINDLEDSDGKEDEERQYEEYLLAKKEVTPEPPNRVNNSVNDNNFNVGPNSIREDTNKLKLEKKEVLGELFTEEISNEYFQKVKDLTLFGEGKKFDKMFEFIHSLSYNRITNPAAFGKNGKLERPPITVQKSLMVTYKRRMKQEFDESQLHQMLETNYENQIIPLIFENRSIFLVNIRHTEGINCIVKVACISNRVSRSEREIMKNYAFRRLIEIYVAKYNRLVIKIYCNIICVRSASFYKIAMQSICTLHYILWRNKFNVSSVKPRNEALDSYISFFENMLTCTSQGDLFKAELNLKRLIKYVLQNNE